MDVEPRYFHSMSDEEYKQSKRDVYVTTAILSIVTIVEVVLAVIYDKYLVYGEGMSRVPLMIFVALASFIKAYYIMGVFMHVKHEKKSFILTITLPTMFLVWAIIAFSWEGVSWNAMREFINSF